MKTKIILRLILAIICCEIALAIFTTIAQEALFYGISLKYSTFPELLFGGLATFLAAILAGIISRVIAKRQFNIVPSVISILIIVEITYLIINNKTIDPIWFDSLAGVSLVIGIWIGFNYEKVISSRKI